MSDIPTSLNSSAAVRGGPSWKSARRLMHGRAGLALVDQAVISAANFATNIIVGRAVTQTDFGAYILALSLLYLAKGVQETLVSAPFIVFRQRKRGHRLKSYRASSAAYQAVTTLAVLLGTPFLALGMAWWGASETLVRAALIMLAAAPFLMLRDYLRRVSFAEFRFGLALSMDVLITFTQVVCLMLLWIFGHMTALGAFAAMGFACLVGTTMWVGRRPVEVELDTRRLREDWANDFRFGRWALLTFLVGCSTPYIMPWLLGITCGGVAVARFGAAQTLVGLGNMFVLGVNNLLGPQAAKSFSIGGRVRLSKTLCKTAAVFVVVVGAFSVALWFWGDFAVELALGGKYLQLRNTMVLLALAMLFGSLKMTGGSGLSAMHQPKLNIPGDITMLVVSLSAGMWLTERYAETGTAAAIAIGAASACLVRWWTVLACLRRGQGENARPAPAETPPPSEPWQSDGDRGGISDQIEVAS